MCTSCGHAKCILFCKILLYLYAKQENHACQKNSPILCTFLVCFCPFPWVKSTNLVALENQHLEGLQLLCKEFQKRDYYAPCPAKGRAPPKAVNGRGRAGCSYVLYTFICTFKFTSLNQCLLQNCYCSWLLLVTTL